MKELLIYLPLLLILTSCFNSGPTALPDKRTQVPGSEKVTRYLEQTTGPKSIHCIGDGPGSSAKPKSFFHSDYAKITINHVGQETSHTWDKSWNAVIGDELEEKFPDLVSDKMELHEGELAMLGCPGFTNSSKKDKKRFWALFLASLARLQSGLDPAFREGKTAGLFALEPSLVSSFGGECEGKDEYDFLEPLYSFGCVFEVLNSGLKSSGKLFSSDPKAQGVFKSLIGDRRYEFFKFFKAHAASQFSFCNQALPSSLINTNIPGERSTEECNREDVDKVSNGLDRGKTTGKDGVTSIEETQNNDGAGNLGNSSNATDSDNSSELSNEYSGRGK